MAHRLRVGRMCRRGPDNIARRTRDPAAEAPAEFDTSELTTGMTAAFNRAALPQPLAWRHLASRYRRKQVASCWTTQSPIRILGETEASRPASVVASRPPALADAKGGASQFIAEQFKPDERVAGSVGVAFGSVAIASSLVTMRAQRAFTSAYVFKT